MLSILSWWRARKPPADVRVAVFNHLTTLRRYYPRYTDKRIAAVRQLAEMSLSSAERAEVTSFLLRILTGQARETAFAAICRAAGGCFQVGAVLGACISVAGIFSDPLPFHLPPEKRFGVAIPALAVVSFVLLGPVAALFNVWRSRRANDRVRAECAAALGRLGCREALCALADLVRSRDQNMREQATTGLWRLLPSLGERGLQPLTSAESAALARSLPHLPDRAAGCALEALERLGAPSAVVCLRAYAEQAADDALAEQACRAMEAIEARYDVERQRRTLLRPAGREDTTILLHPAAAAETDEALLLRSAVEEA